MKPEDVVRIGLGIFDDAMPQDECGIAIHTSACCQHWIDTGRRLCDEDDLVTPLGQCIAEQDWTGVDGKCPGCGECCGFTNLHHSRKDGDDQC